MPSAIQLAPRTHEFNSHPPLSSAPAHRLSKTHVATKLSFINQPRSTLSTKPASKAFGLNPQTIQIWPSCPYATRYKPSTAHIYTSRAYSEKNTWRVTNPKNAPTNQRNQDLKPTSTYLRPSELLSLDEMDHLYTFVWPDVPPFSSTTIQPNDQCFHGATIGPQGVTAPPRA